MTMMQVFRRSFLLAWRNLSLVAVLYLINFLLASVIALSFRGLVAGIGSAGSLGPLLKDFDLTLFADFLRIHTEGISTLWNVVTFMTILSVPTGAVMSGGVLSVLGSGSSSPLQALLAGCGAFAVRFLRLLLFTCVIAVVAVVALAVAGGWVIHAVTNGGTSEIPLFEGVAGTAIAWGCVIMLLVMLADYARVLTVRSDSRSMVRALAGSFVFIGKHAPGTVMLQLLCVAVSACLAAAYLYAAGAVGMDSGWRIVLVVLLQQAFVLGRTFMRVAQVSCELTFVRSREDLSTTGEPA